ncbi:putative nuclease harbi1 [Phtheirospermum japonicum]|uniref:Putative nuclease harbi1 n=1 Tax=Phtheirospermum japonicum TaxID=374723 RepID=A0A830CVK6_9LAMI|nr:putative nuclease harbi1 [Phtheirospermum japonicum]
MWRLFKGCLGALDGTYISVQVPLTKQPRYRTRKGGVAVNVLGVSNQNMKFIYVLSVWEGSATDNRVLRDAICRPNGLRVPSSNYYLCDYGYANRSGFLAPYRGVRYHLKEWLNGPSGPQDYTELFNLRHAKARNVIGHFFGLLKQRWVILRSSAFYPIRTQNRIITACALLKNYICSAMVVDLLEGEEPDEADDVTQEQHLEYVDQVQPTDEWTNFRDSMALNMYNEW